MRTMILLCSSVFLVIVGVCFGISWYMQSSHLQSAIKEAFERINAKETYISYDALETSGFPSRLKLTIVNPHFKGRFDQFLKEFAGMEHANLPEWQDDSKLDGQITLGLNLFANSYTLEVSGNWKATDTIAGQTHHISTAISGSSYCELEFTNEMGIFDTLWDYHALAERKPSDLARDFRKLDCNFPAYTMTDSQSGEALMSSGPARFFASNAPERDKNKTQARLYLDFKDTLVTPLGDKILSNFMTGLFPGKAVPTAFSAYGKKNAAVDVSYDGPVDLGKTLGSTPLEMHINTFRLNNLAYQSDGWLHFSNGGDDKQRTIKLAFNFDSNYEESYDALLHETVRGFILQLYSPFAPQPADIQPLIRKYNADQLYDIINPAIPNMHSLGKLNQSLEFTYQGTPDMTQGDITFTGLNLGSALYGLSGRGSIKLTAGQPIPAANIMLTCTNCPRLVDDMTDYTLRVQHMTRTLAGEESQPVNIFTAPQSSGIKDFLAALAIPNKDDMDKGSFNYHIVSGGASGITISGKKLDEVMALYSQTAAPALHQP